MADEAGPEDAPAEETAAQADKRRRKMNLRNERDRATYAKTGGRTKKQAVKEKVSAHLHSRRRTSRAG